ncbi:spike base protein, RCAP_Rcc01079 family [Limimaricola sp.]|uniref:spike base protein, RCAP_Rcc01079 family n=1 Tax=Limimaricola sp. TaxID=2211665 RepID=UPI00405A2C8A
MPSFDDFDRHASGLESPLSAAAAILPDDGADLGHVSRALHLGTPGDLRVTMKGGQVVRFAGLGAGWHPLRVSRVHATGTTAGDIVACW